VTVAVVPLPATVATLASLVVHATVAPAMLAPFVSTTAAVSPRVSPTLTMGPLEAAVTLTVAGTGADVVVPSPPPPHAAARPVRTTAHERAACETGDGIPTSPVEWKRDASCVEPAYRPDDRADYSRSAAITG
jgi:hypothetical protein